MDGGDGHADWNLRKFGELFQVLMLCQKKLTVYSAPWVDFDIFFTILCLCKGAK